MDTAAHEQAQREQRIGRREVLLQRRQGLRIQIDAMLMSVKDFFVMRNDDKTYVDSVDYERMKFLLNDAEKKNKELIKVKNEISALNAALGESEE